MNLSIKFMKPQIKGEIIAKNKEIINGDINILILFNLNKYLGKIYNLENYVKYCC